MRFEIPLASQDGTQGHIIVNNKTLTFTFKPKSSSVNDHLDAEINTSLVNSKIALAAEKISLPITEKENTTNGVTYTLNQKVNYIIFKKLLENFSALTPNHCIAKQLDSILDFSKKHFYGYNNKKTNIELSPTDMSPFYEVDYPLEINDFDIEHSMETQNFDTFSSPPYEYNKATSSWSTLFKPFRAEEELTINSEAHFKTRLTYGSEN